MAWRNKKIIFDIILEKNHFILLKREKNNKYELIKI